MSQFKLLPGSKEGLLLSPHSLLSQANTLKNNQLGRERIFKEIITMVTRVSEFLCKECRDYLHIFLMETLCFEAGSDSVAQASQELAILLPRLLDSYDYRHVPPCPAL